jgi:hypothetical protein
MASSEQETHPAGFYRHHARRGQAARDGPPGKPRGRPKKTGGDIQATTKVVDSRSLKSSPPEQAPRMIVSVSDTSSAATGGHAESTA